MGSERKNVGVRSLTERRNGLRGINPGPEKRKPQTPGEGSKKSMRKIMGPYPTILRVTLKNKLQKTKGQTERGVWKVRVKW